MKGVIDQDLRRSFADFDLPTQEMISSSDCQISVVDLDQGMIQSRDYSGAITREDIFTVYLTNICSDPNLVISSHVKPQHFAIAFIRCLS